MLIVAGGCSRQPQPVKLSKKKTDASLSKQSESKLEKDVKVTSDSAPKAEVTIQSISAPNAEATIQSIPAPNAEVTIPSDSAPKAEVTIPTKPVPVPQTVKLSTMPKQSISSSPRLERSDKSVVYIDTPIPETRLTKVKRFSHDPAISGKISRIKKETKTAKEKEFIKLDSGLSQP